MAPFEFKKGLDDFIKNLEEEVVPQKAIEEIQKIKCPICGKFATVKSYSKNGAEFNYCHNELKDRIEQELK